MSRTMSKRGYTLLEILTVIAVISITAAIVYPTFATAQWKARETTCISQMRQIAHALQMYRQDWDGKDTGKNVVDFGLPTVQQDVASGTYVPGYPIDWHIVRCPNIDVSPIMARENPPNFITYSEYMSFPGIDYFKHLSEDPTWPIISCDFHDLAFKYEKSNADNPISLGITLSGSVTRKPLNQMNVDGQRLHILQ